MPTHSQNESAPRALQITPWDRKALQLLADGCAASDVAADLGVGTLEAQARMTELFAALGAATQAEAVAAAHRRGLLTRPSLSPSESL